MAVCSYTVGRLPSASKVEPVYQELLLRPRLRPTEADSYRDKLVVKIGVLGSFQSWNFGLISMGDFDSAYKIGRTG